MVPLAEGTAQEIRTASAKEAAEEKKKQKMLLKAAKELEKERAKAAKQAAAVTAALGADGKTTGKRKNGTATGGAGGGQGPMAKKGKLSGLQQKRNLSQAEHIAAMQMYQPYFVPSQSGDAINATNNVSSIFSPLASGRSARALIRPRVALLGSHIYRKIHWYI